MLVALKGLRAINNVVAAAVPVLAALILGAIVIVVFGGAAARLLIGSGFSMVQELPPLLVPWLVFPLAGMLLRWNSHIAVDLLPSLLSGTRARILKIVVSVVSVIAGVIFCVAGIEAVSLFRLTGQVTEMEWEFPIWWIYLSFPVGFAILVSFAVENILAAATGEVEASHESAAIRPEL